MEHLGLHEFEFEIGLVDFFLHDFGGTDGRLEVLLGRRRVEEFAFEEELGG